MNPLHFVAATLLVGATAGLNAAAVAFVYGIYWKPLPVPDPDRLLSISTATATARHLGLSLPMLVSLRDQLPQLQFTAWAENRSTLVEGSGTRGLRVVWTVSPDFFRVLGVPAAAGRLIDEGDGALTNPEPSPRAVLSQRFADSIFGGADAALNQRITIGTGDFTVVGVVPRHFHGLSLSVEPDVFLPLGAQAIITPQRAATLNAAGALWLKVLARTPPATAVSAIESQLQLAWQHAKEATVPSNYEGNRRRDFLGLALSISDARAGVDDGARDTIGPQAAAVVAAGLLLFLLSTMTFVVLDRARIASQPKTLAIRLLLGAHPLELARASLLDQAGVLLMSAAVAVVSGLFCVRFVQHLLLPSFVISLPNGFDPTLPVAAVGGALILTSAAANSLAIVWRVRAATREAWAAVKAAPPPLPFAVITVQLALAIVLSVSAFAFGRAADTLQTLPAAIDQRGLVIIDLDLQGRGRSALAADELLDQLKSLRGVTAAALSQTSLLKGAPKELVTIAGRQGQEVPAFINTVSPGFFEAIPLQIVKGQDFARPGAASIAPVAIVSASLASRLFAGADPIGEYINVGSLPQHQRLQVIGVVGDAPIYDLRQPTMGAVYRPMPRLLPPALACVVRASTSAPVNALRESIDRTTAHSTIRVERLSDTIRDASLRERAMASLSRWFAAVSVVIASVGLYAFLTVLLKTRMRRTAILMAIGASPRQVSWDSAKFVSGVTLCGALLGGLLLVVAERSVAQLLLGGSFFAEAVIVPSLVAISAVVVGATAMPIWKVATYAPGRLLLNDEDRS